MQLHIIPHDFHGATTQYIRRADDHGEADALGNLFGFDTGTRNAIFRLAQFEFFHEFGKTVAVFRQVNGVGRGAEDGHTRRFQCIGEIEGCLPAKLDDHTMQDSTLLFSVDDFQHVLNSE